MTPKRGIAIVGPGRVGQALGKLLNQAGYSVQIVAARRLGAARSAVRFIGGGRPVKITSPQISDARVILLTTSDAALAPVAGRLAALRKDWSATVVLHTCGSVSVGRISGRARRDQKLEESDPLREFRRRGAAVGSLHPFQTVPNAAAGARSLLGCFWAVDGDRKARGVALDWVKALRGITFGVRSGRRTIYHLAAFLVCPTVVTLMDRSAQLLKRAGVPRETARPMLSQFVAETARNFAELGARRALTGPASRGDWPTIERHIRALRAAAPGLIPLYSALVRAMLRVARRKPPQSLAKLLEARTRQPRR